MTEHELDHILIGKFEGEPQINPEEVAAWKWMDMEMVKTDIKANPGDYTEWFKIIFDKFDKYLTV